MNHPTPQEYGDRATQAVYSVLIEIGQILGAFTDKFVVIGGSVPWLLMPDAQPQHIGTLDVDLSLDAEALQQGQYASLIELLLAAGYERSEGEMKVFQLRRVVPVGDGGPPVPVMIDLLMPRRARIKKNKPPILAGFAVLKADGADVAMEHFVNRELRGRMPDGRPNTVTMKIASIPAFLVMKGYALTGRDKAKDAYDVYYAIKHFPGGPAELGRQCAELLSNEIASGGFSRIVSKFSEAEDYGPHTVRTFLSESAALEGMTPDQAQLDAFMQVRAWAVECGLWRP